MTNGKRPDLRGPSREAGEDSPTTESLRDTPVPRRNYTLAIAVALIVFLVLIGVRVLWSGMSGSPIPTLPHQEESTPQAPAPSN